MHKMHNVIPINNGEQVTNELVKVIDDYFPPWLVDIVSKDTESMPVKYTNSPYADFDKARFFGTMLYLDDKFQDLPYYWFIDYFNRCIYNDICKELNINHCHRILLNGQLPGQNGCNHCDADSKDYLSIIYMAHGNSGDTVIVNEEGNDVERISFKEGRMVIFNSAEYHRGEAPTEGYRVSLGAVYPLKPIQELYSPFITPLT